MQDLSRLILLFLSAKFGYSSLWKEVKRHLSMILGEQITALRKKKSLSQAELGKAVGSSGDIIGRYERNEVKPSIEVVIKIADVLEVSVDYLVGKTDQDLDKSLVKRMIELSQLPEDDKGHIFYTLDNLIRAAKLKTL
jgi:transcriptional regulator with XRE-family HTH domain